MSRLFLFFLTPSRFDTYESHSLVPHAATDFVLVSLDPLGNRLGLPAGLGDLPLHHNKDGWHSVLGSWNATTDNTETVNGGGSSNNSDTPIPPVNPPQNARPDPTLIFCQYHKCSGNRLATPFISYLTCTRHTTLTATGTVLCDSGPHTCAPGRFTCAAPDCSWAGIFKTKQAFNRHYRAKHLNDRVDCPIKGCLYVGDRGIKRADNLPTHLLNKHGKSGNWQRYGN